MFYEPVWDYKNYTLVRRPDTASFYIAWTEPGTRKYLRKSTRTSRLGLAKDRLVEFAEAVERSRLPRGIPEPHEVFVNDAIELYITHRRTDSARSIQTAKSNFTHVRTFLEAHDARYVSDLTPELMDGYQSFRNEQHRARQLDRLRNAEPREGRTDAELKREIQDLSTGTISRELAMLIAALNFTRKRQRLSSVPFIQKTRSAPPRSRWLTREEFRRLHEAATEPHLRDYLLLAIHTLQRPGAIFDLTVDRVYIAERRIDFLNEGAHQTSKGRPSIRIADELVAPLTGMLKSSMSGFVIEYEGRPIRYSIKKSFEAAAVKAGLNGPHTPRDRRVIPYTLRHTGATWLAQAGIDLWQIAGLLGHRDTRMVEQVYAKHHTDFQKQAVSVLGALVAA